MVLLGAVAGVLLLLAVVAIVASRRKPIYRKRGQLLLLNEQRLLVALLQALPSDTILTFKVRLLDIVSAVDAKGRTVDDHLADYCVDFVLVDRITTDVKLCIELDSESQSASERLNKQTLVSRALRRASIPHLRLPLVRFYDPVRLRQVIREQLAAQNAGF